MKKYYVFIFLIINVMSLIALEFIVEDFKQDNLDFTATVESVFDSNGDDCAIIKVETDVTSEIHFVNVEVAKKVKKSPGVFYFYISFREQEIKITAENYMPMSYPFPFNLEGKKAYTLKLKSHGEAIKQEDLLTVILDVKPVGSKVLIDGVIVEQDFVKLVKGKHTFEISKVGFVSDVAEIDIQKDTSLEFRLKHAKKYKVEFSSSPEKATVRVDGKLIGQTPCADLLHSGRHEVVVEKVNYKEQTRIINIEDKQQLHFTLVKDVAKVNIDIPDYCKLYIDGRSYSSGLGIELKPGTYSLRIMNPVGEDIMDGFEVTNDLKTIDRTYKPEIKSGTVDIKAFPSHNTKIVLTDALGKRHEDTGLVSFDNICIGDYTIVCSREDYEDYRVTGTMTEDGMEIHECKLKELEGEGDLSLNIKPSHAKLVVTNLKNKKTYKAVPGKKLEDLPVGKYKVQATAKGYTKKSEIITIKKNKKHTVNFKLQERGFRARLNNTLTTRFFYLGGVQHIGRDYEDEYEYSEIFDTENVEGNTQIIYDDIYAHSRFKYGIVGLQADANIGAKIYRKSKTHFPNSSIKEYEDEIMYGAERLEGQLFVDTKDVMLSAHYGRLRSINRYAYIERWGGIGYQFRLRSDVIDLKAMYASRPVALGYSEETSDLTNFDTHENPHISFSFKHKIDKKYYYLIDGITNEEGTKALVNFEYGINAFRARLGYGSVEDEQTAYLVDIGILEGGERKGEDGFVELGCSLGVWEVEEDEDLDYYSSSFVKNALASYLNGFHFLKLDTNPLSDSIDNANENPSDYVIAWAPISEESIYYMVYANFKPVFSKNFSPYWYNGAIFCNGAAIYETDLGAEFKLVNNNTHKLFFNVLCAFIHQRNVYGDSYEDDYNGDWKQFVEQNIFGLKAELSWRLW